MRLKDGAVTLSIISTLFFGFSMLNFASDHYSVLLISISNIAIIDSML